jgi:hypothetical protein
VKALSSTLLQVQRSAQPLVCATASGPLVYGVSRNVRYSSDSDLAGEVWVV